MGYWSDPVDVVRERLASPEDGLTTDEAVRRLAEAPPPLTRRRSGDAVLLARQFRSPILLLLVAAAVLSQFLGESTDAAIVAAIVLASGLLGFAQERGAERAVDALLASVRVRCRVWRDGVVAEVPWSTVVSGDVVELRAGDVVPGDGVVLDATSMLVDESAITGESYPRHKHPGPVAEGVTGSERSNVVLLGSHVASGEGRMLVVETGRATEFGKVAAHLAERHLPTSFERGIASFGRMVLATTSVLVVVCFAINVGLQRPFVDSLLFALALAVGLTPQMLPAIVSLSLSKGARQMAARRVIVKRLDAIEDVGSLDVLCTDKTGTLTTGSVALERCERVDGTVDPVIATLAWWNAQHQSGFDNPIDSAVLAAVPAPVDGGRRLAELPFDFTRKRVSVAVGLATGGRLITKGAVDQVLECCTTVAGAPIGPRLDDVRRRFGELSSAGHRVLAIAARDLGGAPTTLTVADEAGLDLIGFLLFSDPPKPGARQAVDDLRRLAVSVRLVTGDNRYAAALIAGEMGLRTDGLLTGVDIDLLDDAALAVAADGVDVFAEVEPLHKERIVRALSAAGHTVGFLGDGINDTPALHAADVGISVDTAVDVAKQTADLVLLDKDLGVLQRGIESGRTIFANTLKYIHVTISANFGNMLSMAASAGLLPFLPLVPTQILLLNFMSDIPGMTIATDRVDPEQLGRPTRWDVREVRRFMIVFGLVSTVFDLTAFAVLRVLLHADATEFRTGWFVESTLTELVIMLVLRTRRAAVRSRPSRALLWSSVAVAVLTVVLPWSPLASTLGMAAPPLALLAAVLAIVVAYAAVSEGLKLWLARR
ncbi:MAG: magnesium-translocating P-type ATPase [Ilumatobacteraceae bacterium]